jgi:hypothetical protein
LALQAFRPTPPEAFHSPTELAELACRCPALRSVHYYHAPGAGPPLHLLAPLPSLAHLSLSGGRPAALGLPGLLRGLHLHTLVLHHLDGLTSSDVAATLALCPALTSLSLDLSTFEDEEAERPGQWPVALGLQTLRVVGPAPGRLVARLLLASPGLASLHLSRPGPELGAALAAGDGLCPNKGRSIWRTERRTKRRRERRTGFLRVLMSNIQAASAGSGSSGARRTALSGLPSSPPS